MTGAIRVARTKAGRYREGVARVSARENRNTRGRVAIAILYRHAKAGGWYGNVLCYVRGCQVHLHNPTVCRRKYIADAYGAHARNAEGIQIAKIIHPCIANNAVMAVRVSIGLNR